MTTATSRRQPELTRQTVVIGGSAGIVLETARRARAGGAGMILTGATPTAWGGPRPACRIRPAV